MTFEQLSLNPSLLKAIQARGYNQPTPVQQQVIPLVLQGKDVLASAQTGTGKTAAFVLPALQLLSQSVKKSSRKLRVLILAPTRELADQINHSAQQYGKFLPFKANSITGGIPYGKQLRALARGNDILVATPGRLLDHIRQKHIDLSQVEMLVIDEFDRMLDMGFIDDVKQIISLCSAQRQTLLFSATVDKQLINLTASFLNKPEQIHLSAVQQKTLIDQQLYLVRNQQHKDELLAKILSKGSIFKAIVFSGTKRHCEVLAQQLSAQGYLVGVLHGDLKQRQRQAMLDKLRRDKVQILVATDVAARGIDVTDITHVINYDFPRFAEDYVHRIGRTGRAGKSGVAISFVAASEVRCLKGVEKISGQSLSLIKPEGMENFKIEKPMKGKSGRANRSHSSQKRSFKKRPSRFAKGEHLERKNGSDRQEKNGYGNRSEKSDRFSQEGKRKKFASSERSNYAERSEKSDRFSQEGKRKRFASPERSNYAERSEKSDRFSEEGKRKKFGRPKRSNHVDRSEKATKSGYASRAKNHGRGEGASNFGHGRRDRAKN